MTEEKFEKSIENIFTLPWQTELIISGIFTLAMLLIGWRLFAKDKKSIGGVCIGLGIIVAVACIMQLFIRA